MRDVQTPFEAIGGHVMIHVAVGEFYARVRADPRLDVYFAGVSLRRLEAHLAAVIAQTLDGPAQSTGRPLREAHAGLGITEEHFERLVWHLAETLADMGVDAALVDRVLDRLVPSQGEIIEASVWSTAA